MIDDVLLLWFDVYSLHFYELLVELPEQEIDKNS